MRASVELGLVVAIVAAVSVLVLLRPGRNVIAAPPQVQATQLSPAPPRLPPDAVVLAKEVGPLGLAIGLEPRRVTAIVLSPAGGGLSGLDVRLDGNAASACGHGCYHAELAPGRTIAVEVSGFGPVRKTSFDVPRLSRPADGLVRLLQRRFRALASIRFAEQLRSDQTHGITARWLLERPNRVDYAIPGGAQGIVIGGHGWDRATPAAKWQESVQTPLTQPATQWNYATNAVDPSVPAYFTVRFDATTLLPRVLHMTAAAHFMTDRYVSFNSRRAIYPPR